MTVSNNKTSVLIESQLPDFIRNDHPNFVAFLEAYYQFLEQNNGVTSQAKEVRTFQDIDLTESQFTQRLYSTFLRLLPPTIMADEALVLKNIKDFYRAKGTEKSVRFLFNILFAENDISFYYPKKDILRVSDGKWYIQRSLRINGTTKDNVAAPDYGTLQNYVRTQITGQTSNAHASIESVDRYYERTTQIDELVLSFINGTFINGENVSAVYLDTANTSHYLQSQIFSGIINTITITNAGSGYQVGDPALVIRTSNVGAGACVVVSSVSTGNLSSITILDGGAGYQNGNSILFSLGPGQSGSGANANVNSVLADSSVHPNSYNIVASTISLEANTVIGNMTPYTADAYGNLAVIYTNTSNLTVNTGTGIATTINLSAWVANSNVYFQQYDYLNVANTKVVITSLNSISNILTVNPGLPANLSLNVVQVIKHANVNTAIGNAFTYWTYANTGPAQSILVISTGAGYTATPSMSIVANSFVQSLGILGKMKILNPGQNYANGNIIQFTNVNGGLGQGANAIVASVNATGAIQKVQFAASPYSPYIGGSGYSQQFLPNATVISGSGTGANIAVTAILGSGASLFAANSVIGGIQRLTIVNAGAGYNQPPLIDLSHSGDGKATANASIIQGLYSYPGRFLNDDGQVSSYNFLQDRDYYQNFSYVIESSLSFDKYATVIRVLVHPVGTKLFGKVIIIDQSLPNNPLVGNDSKRLILKYRTFTKTGNTINVAYTGHGFANGNNVVLEFSDANAYTNTRNGIYSNIIVPNPNFFLANSSTRYVVGSQNTSGNVYVALFNI